MQEPIIKGPIEYIKEAWKIYTKKENFIYFAKIMTVLTVLSALITFLHDYLSKFVFDSQTGRFDFDNLVIVVSYIFISIIFFVFFFYQSSTTYVALLNINSNIKDIFKSGFKNMGKVFLMMLALWILFLLGFLLFIIPGFIFMTWYIFAIYLVIDKKYGVNMALKESKVLVKGRFWKVFGRNLAFGLLTLLIGFITALIPQVGSILSLFIAPLFMLPYYLLYRDLSAGSRLDDLRAA